MSQPPNDRQITQWQLGEWDALESEEAETLLKVAARLELGDLSATTEPSFIEAERNQKLQLLRSTIHNGLGRSSLLLNRQEAAHQHFFLALQQGPCPGDPELLAPLRMAHQANKLGLNLNHFAALQLNI